MDKKDQVIDLLEFAYSEMCAYAGWLDPQERQKVGEVDRWSPRDVLAHLAEEHRYVAERLAAGPGAAFTGRGEDYNQINRDIWQAYRDKSFDQILQILSDAQLNLLRSLDGVSAEDFETQGRYPWTGERPLWRYLVGILVMHSVSHLCQQYIAAKAIDKARELSDEVSTRTIALDAELGPTATYNQACISALVGDREIALEQLRRALTQTPGLIEWAQEDGDLASLHGTPEFSRLLEELRSS